MNKINVNAAILVLLLLLSLVSFNAVSAFKSGGTSSTAIQGDIGDETAKQGSSPNYDIRVGAGPVSAKGVAGQYTIFLGWIRVGTAAATASPSQLYSSMAYPLSTADGDRLTFSATVTNNASEQILVLIPSVLVSPAGGAKYLTISPSNLSMFPMGSTVNFTVNFSYPAVGKVTAAFSVSGVLQSSGAQIFSNSIATSLYIGSQFSLSLSSNKLEILPNGGSSISILAKNTAAFTRKQVRIRLADTACCSFSLAPNGVDIPVGSAATFTLTLSPVSTARPGTTYTTNIVAYTDTEPSLASADFTVSILTDPVPETGAAREKALSAIKTANDTIVFVDVRIADAEKQKLDTYRAATTLAEARSLYNQALELLDGSNYDGAYLKATDASTKARSALILIPSARSVSGVAVTKETADAAIKTADETIFFVDKQVADAEKQSLDTYKAATTLAEARGLIKQAKAALESGDYSGAADLAAQATTLATSALQSIPKPGQIPVAKLATVAGAVLLIGAIIYFKFIRKQPPQQQAQYYPRS